MNVNIGKDWIEIGYVRDALDYGKYYEIYDNIIANLTDHLTKEENKYFDNLAKKDVDECRDQEWDKIHELFHKKLKQENYLVEIDEWSTAFKDKPMLLLKQPN